MSGIEDSWRSIADRRSVKVRKQIALIQRVSAQQQFVTDNRALLDQLLSVSPPNQLQSLYQDTREWLEALDRWLSLGLESFNTNDTRKLDQANDMISEVNSRGFLVSREINSTQIIYGLED